MSDFSTRRVMMVDTQVRPSDVTKFPIIAAMLSVPREDYVPAAQREAAYIGLNIEYAAGRVVLEPRTLSKLLDFLDISPNDHVLDVGAGFGYAVAVLAEMQASVVAVEADAGAAASASAHLAAAGLDGVKFISGPLHDGAPAEAPYDVILIEGGVEEVPAPLVAQLKDGGRIGAIFMQGALGTVRIGLKRDGVVNWRFAFNATAPILPGFAAARKFVL